MALQCTAGVYLSLTGTADVSDDPQLIGQLWRPSYRAWFPDGAEDADAAVVSVSVDSADLWEAPTSSVTRLFGAARALLTHQRFETPRRRIDDPLQSRGDETR